MNMNVDIDSDLQSDRIQNGEDNDKFMNKVKDPKIFQFQDEQWNKIPVVIKSKHGKILSYFTNNNNNKNNHHQTISIPIKVDDNDSSTSMYDKLNEIAERNNAPKTKSKTKPKRGSHNLSIPTSAIDQVSKSVMEVLYGQLNDNKKKRKRKRKRKRDSNTNSDTDIEPPPKRRKITDKEEQSDDDENQDINNINMENRKECKNNVEIGMELELDSFRQLMNKDIIIDPKNEKDSLCKHLSDTVYELYERIRTNDNIKHMIRTNLANKIKTENMIEYEKLHEIMVKHCIEHSCIWLRIRSSLARYVFFLYLFITYNYLYCSKGIFGFKWNI